MLTSSLDDDRRRSPCAGNPDQQAARQQELEEGHHENKSGSPVVGESIKVPSGDPEFDPEEVRRQLKVVIMKDSRNR